MRLLTYSGRTTGQHHSSPDQNSSWHCISNKNRVACAVDQDLHLGFLAAFDYTSKRLRSGCSADMATIKVTLNFGDNWDMASINDKDRNIFQEAEKTVLDNFTESELEEIRRMASRVEAIIKAAKERQQEGLREPRAKAKVSR